jgi:hypothetical protein
VNFSLFHAGHPVDMHSYIAQHHCAWSYLFVIFPGWNQVIIDISDIMLNELRSIVMK